MSNPKKTKGKKVVPLKFKKLNPQELREMIPAVERILESLERAKRVSRETLEMRITI